MTTRCLSIAIVCLVSPCAQIAAQGLDELVAAGRYEDAAASLQAASPDEARAGAMLIFNHAYQNGFQRERFVDAVRGFVAAKQVPRLDERDLQMLDFWHGMALYTSIQVPGVNALSVDEAVAVLEEAEALLIASGDYPRRANLPDVAADVEMLLEMSGRARARD